MGKAEILAGLDAANASINNVDADIDRLQAQINAGGLTPAEVAEIQTKIDELKANAQRVADKTPENAEPVS